MNDKERDDGTRDDADLNSPQLRSSSYLTPIEKPWLIRDLSLDAGLAKNASSWDGGN